MGTRRRGAQPGWDGLQRGVCAQEGFLAEMSLDLGLQAHVHVSQEAKWVGRPGPRAVGTACVETSKGEHGCSGSRRVRYGLLG